MAKGKHKTTTLKNVSKPTSSTKESATLIFSDFLYLGPCSAASSAPFLSRNSITHVLSVGATPASPVPGVTYDRLALTDSPSSSVEKIYGAADAIIDRAAKHKNGTGRILVHCSAGISRSPTVVTAYLMSRHGMSLLEALGTVVLKRPTVSPNPGFLRQLKELEMKLYGKVTLETDELPKRREDREAVFKTVQTNAPTYDIIFSMSVCKKYMLTTSVLQSLGDSWVSAQNEARMEVRHSQLRPPQRDGVIIKDPVRRHTTAHRVRAGADVVFLWDRRAAIRNDEGGTTTTAAVAAPGDHKGLDSMYNQHGSGRGSQGCQGDETPPGLIMKNMRSVGPISRYAYIS